MDLPSLMVSSPSALRLASQASRRCFARPSGTHSLPGRRRPPLVATVIERSPPHSARARAINRSLCPRSVSFWVRVGGVEHRDAGIECGANDGEGALVVAVARGREPHASEADHGLQTPSHTTGPRSPRRHWGLDAPATVVNLSRERSAPVPRQPRTTQSNGTNRPTESPAGRTARLPRRAANCRR